MYQVSDLMNYIVTIKDISIQKEIERRLLKLEKMEEQERKDKIRWKKLCQNKLY